MSLLINWRRQQTKTKNLQQNSEISNSTKVKQQSIEKWQTQWEQTTKGSTKNSFFSNIKERL